MEPCASIEERTTAGGEALRGPDVELDEIPLRTRKPGQFLTSSPKSLAEKSRSTKTLCKSETFQALRLSPQSTTYDLLRIFLGFRPKTCSAVPITSNSSTRPLPGSRACCRASRSIQSRHFTNITRQQLRSFCIKYHFAAKCGTSRQSPETAPRSTYIASVGDLPVAAHKVRKFTNGIKAATTTTKLGRASATVPKHFQLLSQLPQLLEALHDGTKSSSTEQSRCEREFTLGDWWVGSANSYSPCPRRSRSCSVFTADFQTKKTFCRTNSRHVLSHSPLPRAS